jgi:hypothetical protein
LKRVEGSGLESSGSGEGLVNGSCEHVPINVVKLLTYLIFIFLMSFLLSFRYLMCNITK